MNGLQEIYQQRVLSQLQKKLGETNPWAVPRLRKIVLNVGMGEAVEDKGVIEKAAVTLAAISGQKPKVTRARQAISTFKLREGMQIGLTVTLRGERMFAFLEKLIRIVLPRLRDFQGVSRTSFDGRGNYSLGLAEQQVFPDVDYEKIDKPRGLQVTIVTTAKNDAQAEALLEAMGMPFTKKEEDGE